MKPQHVEFGIFLFQLIDIQIKKYLKLSEIGVGPDAGMNADLVRGEVDELLVLGDQFMSGVQNYTLDDKQLARFVSQVRFFLAMEDHRATAGELLDSNNIHNTAYDRLQKQLRELNQFALKYGLSVPPIKARTRLQKQCEFDSFAIADFIVHSALVLEANPDAALPQGLVDYTADMMKHAESIMRKNARQGRYSLPEVIKQLHAGHRHFQNGLSNSTLKKSKVPLSNDEAKKAAATHGSFFKEILNRYDHFAPTDKVSLFISWYEIPFLAKREKNRPIPQFKFPEEANGRPFSCCSSTLFCKKVGLAALGVTAAAVGITAAAFTAVALTYRS